MIIKEACIGNIKDVKYYLNKLNEINRFETCSNLKKGGLTPKIWTYKYIDKKTRNIPQIVMIRKTNTFIIENSNEINKMIKQIRKFIKVGAKNFIFGYITKKNKIDIESCKLLIQEIKKTKNTTWSFHMAIDLVDNYEEAFNTLIELGFKRVLTKGGNGEAIKNIVNLKKIYIEFGNKIEILVGGKVTKDNYKIIHDKTQITQFHGTKIA